MSSFVVKTEILQLERISKLKASHAERLREADSQLQLERFQHIVDREKMTILP
jgi:hypothetical protein